jgi:hypothetical protein
MERKETEGKSESPREAKGDDKESKPSDDELLEAVNM